MSLVYYMNCSRAMADMELSLNACRDILDKWNSLVEMGSCPKYWPEVGDFWYCLAEMLGVKEDRTADEQRELEHASGMCCKIRTVCYGRDDVRTLDARALLDGGE